MGLYFLLFLYRDIPFSKAVIAADLHFLHDKDASTSLLDSLIQHDSIEQLEYEYYLADFLTDRAEDFIRRHQDRPFLLCLHHFAVHAPHDAKPELIARFRDKPAVGGHNNPTYAAMITSVDQSVGRVMQLLDRLGLAENTVLIFSSDNGGVGGYVREGIKRAGDITDNAPLRSGKGCLYDRSPCRARGRSSASSRRRAAP